HESSRESFFVLDHWRSAAHSQARQLRNRNLRSVRSRDEDSAQLGQVVAETAGISNAYRVSLPAFDGCRDFLAAYGRFEDLVHLGDVQIVASGFFALHLVINVIPPGNAFEECG